VTALGCEALPLGVCGTSSWGVWHFLLGCEALPLGVCGTSWGVWHFLLGCVALPLVEISKTCDLSGVLNVGCEAMRSPPL